MKLGRVLWEQKGHDFIAAVCREVRDDLGRAYSPATNRHFPLVSMYIRLVADLGRNRPEYQVKI